MKEITVPNIPADLRVIACRPLASPNSTPLSDIETMRIVARSRYGIEIDRVEFSDSTYAELCKVPQFDRSIIPVNFPRFFLDQDVPFAWAYLYAGSEEIKATIQW